MLTCQFISCLSQVQGYELILSPEIEQFLGDAERCAEVVDWYRSSFAEFLQDGFEVFLGF